jgi:hypothetical protein
LAAIHLRARRRIGEISASLEKITPVEKGELVPERKFGILQKPPLALRIKAIAQA